MSWVRHMQGGAGRRREAAPGMRPPHPERVNIEDFSIPLPFPWKRIQGPFPRRPRRAGGFLRFGLALFACPPARGRLGRWLSGSHRPEVVFPTALYPGGGPNGRPPGARRPQPAGLEPGQGRPRGFPAGQAHGAHAPLSPARPRPVPCAFGSPRSGSHRFLTNRVNQGFQLRLQDKAIDPRLNSRDAILDGGGGGKACGFCTYS